MLLLTSHGDGSDSNWRFIHTAATQMCSGNGLLFARHHCAIKENHHCTVNDHICGKQASIVERSLFSRCLSGLCARRRTAPSVFPSSSSLTWLNETHVDKGQLAGRPLTRRRTLSRSSLLCLFKNNFTCLPPRLFLCLFCFYLSLWCLQGHRDALGIQLWKTMHPLKNRFQQHSSFRITKPVLSQYTEILSKDAVTWFNLDRSCVQTLLSICYLVHWIHFLSGILCKIDATCSETV